MRAELSDTAIGSGRCTGSAVHMSLHTLTGTAQAASAHRAAVDHCSKGFGTARLADLLGAAISAPARCARHHRWGTALLRIREVNRRQRIRYGRVMTDALPSPRTTWEYCLSAADELVLWHIREGGAVPEAARPRVVTLMGAAVYGLATSISLSGPGIADLPLTGSGGSSASIRGVLRYHALAALQRCPFDVRGAAEREELLAAYGSDTFVSARDTAITVIDHLVRAAGQAGHLCPTIRDCVMSGVPETGSRVGVEEARSRQQFLTVAGMIWIVDGAGASRPPVVCTRCGAHTGLTLQVDTEAGSVRVICPGRHLTDDRRLTVTRVQELIALAGASSSGDIEITS